MNERDEFWKGDFGNEYNRRSPGDVEANYHLFKRIFAERRVESVVELGAGTASCRAPEGRTVTTRCSRSSSWARGRSW
jgi:hypothetical protein